MCSKATGRWPAEVYSWADDNHELGAPEKLEGPIQEAAPHPLEIWTPLPSEFPLPSVGGGGGYGYFLELHNAYLTGYTEAGGVRFLAVASTLAAKLWGIFEYTLARQSALITSLFTQLCRLKIWTNLTLKTKLCACRCWVMDKGIFFFKSISLKPIQQARDGNFFLFVLFTALPDVSWLLLVYANTDFMLLCLRLFYMTGLIFSLA